MALLNIEEVKVRYGEAEALHGVSLSVEPGEFVAVVGPNGAGKTSLMKAIMGLVDHVEGRIRFDGRDLSPLPAWERAAVGMAYVPEGRRIFPLLTVEENLRVGSIRTRHAKDIKRRLEHIYSIFPRLAERSRQIAGTLSGGEQQMLAIGRALMADPKLLLIDEISMGLAPIIVDQVLQLVRDLNRQGLTVLLVEQNARKALRVADRAYLLQTGYVIMSASTEELVHHPEFEQVYFGNLTQVGAGDRKG